MIFKKILKNESGRSGKMRLFVNQGIPMFPVLEVEKF